MSFLQVEGAVKRVPGGTSALLQVSLELGFPRAGWLSTLESMAGSQLPNKNFPLKLGTQTGF